MHTHARAHTHTHTRTRTHTHTHTHTVDRREGTFSYTPLAENCLVRRQGNISYTPGPTIYLGLAESLFYTHRDAIYPVVRRFGSLTLPVLETVWSFDQSEGR